MKWNWSPYGEQFTRDTGILELMNDLGEAMARGDADLCMLGGGNPAAIPGVQEHFAKEWGQLLNRSSELDQVLGAYDTSQGSPRFLESLANYLNQRYGWGIDAGHIGITNGSQTAFFMLFNLLAGNGRKILLPLSPEYIGYAEQGLEPDLFHSVPGLKRDTAPHRFKYAVDFDRLSLDETVAAVAVSRPTNPTGNVLTDQEMDRLISLTRERECPLLVDNAYGAPFPGILFRDVTLRWEPHVVLSMSLSKLGLPGTRTGIVVADPELIRMLAAVNAVVGLANGNVGQALMRPLLVSGAVDDLCREVIRPFYQTRSKQAARWWEEALAERVPWTRHEAGGSMFHWLRFPGLPGGCRELYRRLKSKQVLVVPGDYFFYGLDAPAEEQQECIRVHTAMDPEKTRRGIGIIADTAAELFA